MSIYLHIFQSKQRFWMQRGRALKIDIKYQREETLCPCVNQVGKAARKRQRHFHFSRKVHLGFFLIKVATFCPAAIRFVCVIVYALINCIDLVFYYIHFAQGGIFTTSYKIPPSCDTFYMCTISCIELTALIYAFYSKHSSFFSYFISRSKFMFSC